MTKKITIDPITRIEGHLSISVDLKEQQVEHAYCVGEMFRGFEVLLKGRDPLDAQQITQRICGICPVSHGIASIAAQEEAYNVSAPENGRIVRNLILGANYLQSHITHFYHLSAIDFIDITTILHYQGKDHKLTSLKDWVQNQIQSKMIYPATPFLPRYDVHYLDNNDLNLTAIKHYIDALEIRQIAHQAAAVFCGKMPHATALVPGGVTEQITASKIAEYRSKLKRILAFIDQCYLPDVTAVASLFPDYFTHGKGNNHFLAYGVFHEPLVIT